MNLIQITQENLDALVLETAQRLIPHVKQAKWLSPKEAERRLCLKTPTILKLWKDGKIDLTFYSDRKWQVDAQSIDKFLESNRNNNRR